MGAKDSQCKSTTYPGRGNSPELFHQSTSWQSRAELVFKGKDVYPVPYKAQTLKPRGWIHPEKRRPNSAARGYGSAWRRIRARVLGQHPICVVCRIAPSNTVDHKLTKARAAVMMKIIWRCVVSAIAGKLPSSTTDREEDECLRRGIYWLWVNLPVHQQHHEKTNDPGQSSGAKGCPEFITELH